jgi:uncharacterized protein (TIGR02145 family)
MKWKTKISIYPFAILGIVLVLLCSCKKSSEENNNPIPGDGTIFNPGLTYGSMTDNEGNVYKTIIIGTQTWMAENLKTTKFNDGTSIPLLRNCNNWWDNIQTNPCYCWYMDDSIKYKNTYGALYNWYAVNTGKLPAAGWHIPTEADFDTLITFLGGEYIAGGKLKSAGSLDKGTGIWYQPNEGANNSSGFSGVPGGERYVIDNNMGGSGNWWMIIESSNPDVVGYFNLSSAYARGQLLRTFHKATGYSVRCIKG